MGFSSVNYTGSIRMIKLSNTPFKAYISYVNPFKSNQQNQALHKYKTKHTYKHEIAENTPQDYSGTLNGSVNQNSI